MINYNLMVAPEVLREYLRAALDAHKDVGAIIFKVSEDDAVRNLFTRGVK